jgi:hypothetical protein
LLWQKSTWTLQGTLERAFLLSENGSRVKFLPDGSKKGLKGISEGLILGCYHYHYYNSIRIYVVIFLVSGGKRAILGVKIGSERFLEC